MSLSKNDLSLGGSAGSVLSGLRLGGTRVQHSFIEGNANGAMTRQNLFSKRCGWKVWKVLTGEFLGAKRKCPRSMQGTQRSQNAAFRT